MKNIEKLFENITNWIIRVCVILATGCAIGEVIAHWKDGAVVIVFVLVAVLCIAILYLLFKEHKASKKC